MRNFIKILPLAALALVGCASDNLDYTPLDNPFRGGGDQTLATYDWPQGLPEARRSTVYSVTLVQGSTRTEIPVYVSNCPEYVPGYMNMTPTDQYPLAIFAGRSISWANFSFDEAVTVEVTVLDTGKVPVSGNSAKVLPSRYGITPAVQGNTVVFTMERQGQCSVEIGPNGYKHGLMLFANPMETEAPTSQTDGYAALTGATATTVAAVPPTATGLYFEPGTHDIGIYTVPSNIKNIYIPGDAWVYGTLILNGNPNVKIFGRGVLSADKINYRASHSIEAINGSDNTIIDGITIADQKRFSVRLISASNTVAWTKIIGGWVYNTDGIAAYENSHVHHCFTWANDDNIKAYRTGVTFEDMVLWQLNNGGAIQMGWVGPQSENISIKRVDILRGEWNKDEFNRGVLCLVGNDEQSDASNIYIKNFQVEDLVTENVVPLLYRVTPNSAKPLLPCVVDGVVLKNWNVKMNMGDPSFKNHFKGVSAEQPIKGVVFNNVKINGTKLTGDNWQSYITDVTNTDPFTFQ